MSRTAEIDLSGERDQILEYLRKQLVGPLGGVGDQLNGNPLDRYLHGVPYPQSADASELQKEEESEASAAADDDTDTTRLIRGHSGRVPQETGLCLSAATAQTLRRR